MARPEKFTTTQIIEAIRKAQTAAGAARILECDSDTIRNYAKRHPTVDRALYNEREDLADYAEMGLKRAVLNGEAWAIALAVKTLRKGVYSERQELTGPNGGPVEHEHEHRGQVHGSIEHVAAVVAALVGVGAVPLPGTSAGGDAENDAVHPA
jgi:hypothetical protein